MKRSLAIAGIAIGVLLFSGCSSISTGTITGKDHEDEVQIITYNCVYRDPKTLVCLTQVPVVVTVPESWRFDLKQRNGDTGWVHVSKGTFDHYHVGDFYNDKD